MSEPSALRYGPRAPRVGTLDGSEPYLLERIAHARPRWIAATVLLRKIRQRGYTGGISLLMKWLGPHKRIEPDPVVRFETAPGQQTQADFTTIRHGCDQLLALAATQATAGRVPSSSPTRRMPPRCAPAWSRHSTTLAAFPSMAGGTTPRQLIS
jgi:transposase